MNRQTIIVSIIIDVDDNAADQYPALEGTVYHDDAEPPLGSALNLGYSFASALGRHAREGLKEVMGTRVKFDHLDPLVVSVSVALGTKFEADPTF